MKLTKQKLKQMIIEEMSLIQEDEDSEMMSLLRAQQQKLQADYEAKFAIQSGGRK